MPHSKLRPSFTFDEERINELKKIAPEAFADGNINWQNLRESLGEYLEDEGDYAENFGLFWPGKREARKLASIPSKGTLIPVEGEGIDEENTKNIFIEGENLEVLKLLQKGYADKIKIIFIDPPYNTGNDFVYEDDFKEPLQEYLRRTGQVDEEGKPMTTNTRADGRFHSKWLSMMYPRLRLANKLLREDGLIFITIDDNEVFNLRLLLNESFGEENFIGNIIWNSTKSVTNTALISVSHTHILVFSKDINYFIKNRTHFRFPESGEGFSNPDNDPRGKWKADPFQVGGWRPNQQYEITNPKTGEKFLPNTGCSWKNDYDTFLKLVEDNRIVFGVSGEAGPQRKRFLSEAIERGKVSKTLWDDVATTTNGTTHLKNLFGGVNIFNNPKPVELLERIITLGAHNPKDCIIMDFFAGSGTTAEAVYKLNFKDNGKRKFILAQMPEKCDVNSEAFKVGFKTISDIAKERIRRVIKKINEEKNNNELEFDKEGSSSDLGFKVYKLKESNFKEWKDYKGEDLKELDTLFENSSDPLVYGWKEKNVLTEILLIEGFPIDSKIEIFDKISTNKIYVVSSDFCEHKLLVCLDKNIEQDTINKIEFEENDIFICLDSAITDKDKVNLSDKGFIKTI